MIQLKKCLTVVTDLFAPSRMASPPNTPAHSANSSISSVYSFTEEHGASETEDRIPIFPIRSDSIKQVRSLGDGSCSTVYEFELANRMRQDSMSPLIKPNTTITPPESPVFNRHCTLHSSKDRIPTIFAVKIPTPDRGSRSAVRHEARILTYLRTYEEASTHIITFHGFIESNGAVVLDLLPFSLATFTETTLETASDRTKIVAANMLYLARSLFNSLSWLHSTNTVHGDIKPGNILLRPANRPGNPEFAYDVVLCDFSSAVHTAPKDNASESILPKWGGGGTYDFMSPRFFTFEGAGSAPTRDDDGHAAVMTVLWFALGNSPYRNAGPNRAMRMEWIKKNEPVAFVLADVDLVGRFLDLEKVMWTPEMNRVELRRWFKTGFTQGGWKELF